MGPWAVSNSSNEECVEGGKELDRKGFKISSVLMCNMVGKHHHKIAPPGGKTTCRDKTCLIAWQLSTDWHTKAVRCLPFDNLNHHFRY